MITIFENMEVWREGWRVFEKIEGVRGGSAEGRGGGRVEWLVDLVVSLTWLGSKCMVRNLVPIEMY